MRIRLMGRGACGQEAKAEQVRNMQGKKKKREATTAAKGGPRKRERLVKTLTQEIAEGFYELGVPMPSEHRLCERFGVSRVTVRLALDVLQNRGVIHRQHGRGTFVHDLTQRAFRSPAILMRGGLNVRCHACWQMLHGMEQETGRQQGMVTMTKQAPADWPAQAFEQMGGLVARASLLTRQDVAVLQQKHLPLFKLGNEHLYGASLNFGIPEAAEKMVSAASARGRRRLLFVELREDALAGVKLAQLRVAAQKIRPAVTVVGVAIAMDLPRAEAQVAAAFERERPDAIVLTNEWLAPITFELLERRGLKPASDIFYGMFLHEDYRAMVRPDIAVARLPCCEVGCRIVQFLQDYGYRPESLPDIDLAPTYHGLLAGDG